MWTLPGPFETAFSCVETLDVFFHFICGKSRIETMHGLGDKLARLYTKLESTLLRIETRGQFWAKYRYEIYYLPQILRVYGYHVPTPFSKNGHMNLGKCWQICSFHGAFWVLYVSSIYAWNLKQPFINGCLVKQPFSLYIKIWNHPIETSFYKWFFGVPGSYPQNH